MYIIAIISGILFYLLVIRPFLYKNDEIWSDLEEKFQEAKKEAEWENKRISESHIPPTDEEIDLYYLMYLKKVEITHKNRWTTEQPISKDEFIKDVKLNGFRYLVAITSDMFMMHPNGQNTMSRHMNYKKLVLEEKKESLTKPLIWDKDIIIIINNGDVFEGTIEQFKDNFFSNANRETVKQWCIKNKYSLKVRKKV